MQKIDIHFLTDPFFKWIDDTNKESDKESAAEFCEMHGIKQVIRIENNHFYYTADYYVIDEKKFFLAKLKYGNFDSN